MIKRQFFETSEIVKYRKKQKVVELHWYECSDRIVREAKIKNIRKINK